MKQRNETTSARTSNSSKARTGFGAERPTRRVLEGHTRPCEDCGAVNWNFDVSRGEITCENCGLVAEENVPDPGAEWTNRDNGEDRSRVGRPMTYTLADKGLNTTIDVRDLNTGIASRHGMSSKHDATGDDEGSSMNARKHERAGSESWSKPTNSSGTDPVFRPRFKKKLLGCTVDCQVKGS